eukprot:scaffold9555_cov123-Isochrysis_galbana.AAC.5
MALPMAVSNTAVERAATSHLPSPDSHIRVSSMLAGSRPKSPVRNTPVARDASSVSVSVHQSSRTTRNTAPAPPRLGSASGDRRRARVAATRPGAPAPVLQPPPLARAPSEPAAPSAGRLKLHTSPPSSTIMPRSRSPGAAARSRVLSLGLPRQPIPLPPAHRSSPTAPWCGRPPGPPRTWNSA